MKMEYQENFRLSPVSFTQTEEKIVDFFRNKNEVIAVYLFGSYAQGKERDSSDIDLAVLLENGSKDFYNERKNRYLVELGRITRKDLDIVILNSAGPELLRQIFAKGKCLHVKDLKKLAGYRMVMFAQMAEFGYYKSRLRRGLIKKIMEG